MLRGESLRVQCNSIVKNYSWALDLADLFFKNYCITLQYYTLLFKQNSEFKLPVLPEKQAF